ncbi:MAG: hypothetical protein RII27_07525, partial [Alphaproteobacteria bacterium]
MTLAADTARPSPLAAYGAGADAAQDGTAGCVALRRLTLTGFRNYDRLRLDLDGRPVVLAGANGAGKTNLLEAVSLLAPGRGLRRARLADMARRQPAAEAAEPTGAAVAEAGDLLWAVSARIAGSPLATHGQDLIEVGTGAIVAAASDRAGSDTTGGDTTGGDGAGGEDEAAASVRRVSRIAGKDAGGPQALAGVAAMIWLTPAMDRLFDDSAGERRRFVDRLVHGADRDHAARVSAYERALRERGRLLRGTRPDTIWLAALESEAAAYGVAIAAARRQMVRRLDGALAEGLAGDAFPAAGLHMAGEVETWLDESPAVVAEDRLKAALASGRTRDAEAGRALRGPHRSDLVAHHRARHVPAAGCSTGEQKALLISIVLA